MDIKQRCKAYDLLPVLDREDHSLEGSCGRIIEETCKHALVDEPYLVAEDGSLKKEKGCVALPPVLFDVWSAEQVAHLFNDDARPVLSRHLRSEHRRKLANWNSIDEVGKEDVLSTLKSKHLPNPESWARLLVLWVYVADDMVGYHYGRNHKTARIFPAQGKEVLFSATEVVRLGENKLLQSQEDWQFLANYLLVLNQNWPRYLAERRRKAEQDKVGSLGRQVETAYKVLDDLALGQASDVGQVIQQVAAKVFDQEDCSLTTCVRIAHLAATLGAKVADNFQFVTRGGYRTPASQHVVADLTGDLDTFINKKWYESHALHEAYNSSFTSCTREEWRQWVTSDRSGLLTFVPLIRIQRDVWRCDEILRLLRERGFNGEPKFPYQSGGFTVDDWDFDEEHWNYWKSLAGEDADFWGHMFARVLVQPTRYWSKSLSAQVWQHGYTRRKPVTNADLLPSWIVKFCALPCLRDTRGFYRQPAELLRRTPETETLLEVEHFVRSEDDNDHTRPLLIKLGVRDTPSGPDRLLDRLRALATVASPPVYEVGKWYHRLDQMFDKCSTDELQQIKDAFASEKLILTTESEWVRTPEVFLKADEEDAPGVAVIHAAIRDLSIWLKVGVAERPTGDLALKWLAEIPSHKKLSRGELRRVRALLPRYAERIWLECRHWLNLDGEWAPVEDLAYKLTMQTLIPWANLFRPIKQKIADLQRLSAEMCGLYPFAELPTLAASIEDRLEDEIVESEEALAKLWLTALGNALACVVLDDEVESQLTRELGRRLARTQWQVVAALQSTPYINGTPSGTPRRIDVLWKGTMLYVKSKSMAKIAQAVAQEMGRAFGRTDIADAIKLCFERDPVFVAEYMEENFKLLPPAEVTADETGEVSQEDGNVSSEDDVGIVPTDSVTAHASQTTDADAERPPPGPDADDPEFTGEVSADSQSDPEPDEDGTNDNVPMLRRRPQRPLKPKLIERYAKAHGFAKDDVENRFYRENGSWIERVSGASFPWERYSASGELLQCYWDKDHCIEREPLQLEAEVWELCDKHPEKYTLLLAAPDGTPVVYSGHRLRKLCESGWLTLFPANYRLVFIYSQSEGTGDV